MNRKPEIDICVWQDNVWCHSNDVDEYLRTGFSDDYRIVELPHLPDDIIDVIVSHMSDKSLLSDEGLLNYTFEIIDTLERYCTLERYLL